MLRDTVAAEGQRRAHAERVAAAAEHAAQAAAEDADCTRELLEQANARTPASRARAADVRAPARSRPQQLYRTGTLASTPPRARSRRRRRRRRSARAELKGGLKVSIEHAARSRRQRHGTASRRTHPRARARTASCLARQYSRPASPVQRAEAAARGGGGFAGVSARDNWNKVSAHARRCRAGERSRGLGPNVGYARDPAPTARAQSPYLNPGSASGRERALLRDGANVSVERVSRRRRRILGGARASAAAARPRPPCSRRAPSGCMRPIEVEGAGGRREDGAAEREARRGLSISGDGAGGRAAAGCSRRIEPSAQAEKERGRVVGRGMPSACVCTYLEMSRSDRSA